MCGCRPKKAAMAGAAAAVIVAVAGASIAFNGHETTALQDDVADAGGIEPTGTTKFGVVSDNECPELLRRIGICTDTAPTVDPDDPYLEMLVRGDYFRNINITVNSDDPYLELFMQRDDYLGLSPAEQEEFVRGVAESRASGDEQVRRNQDLLDVLSVLELEAMAAADAGDQERVDLIYSEMFGLLNAYYAVTMAGTGWTPLEDAGNTADPD